MELQDLRYFCLAAELEHITKAAEVLGISQPFLTKVIRRLEEELGAPLFDHQGRTVVLNEYGTVCYKRAKRLLEEADNLTAEIQEMYGKKKLVVSMMTNAVIYVPYLLSAFYEQHSDYTVLISSTSRRRIRRALRSGSIDFALCGPPMDEDIDLGIRTDIIHYEKALLMVPDGSELRNRKSLYLKDLHGQPLVISPPGFAMRDRIDEVLARHGVQPKIIIETGEVSDLIRFVDQGIGSAFMPRSVMEKNAEWKKGCMEIRDMREPGSLGLSYCELPYMREAKRVFRDFMVDFFKHEYGAASLQ